MSGASGAGTARLDDFTLNGSVSLIGGNTSVQFASTGSTVNENVGTVNVTLEISDEDATNDTEVDVVLITGAPGRVNSYTTQTVTFPGGSAADETVTITVTDNSLCDGSTVIGFELQNITGGQGSPFVGTNDTYDLSITDNDVCTGVSFAVTSATVSEGVGTYNVQVNITDFSVSQATTVDVALTSGSAARINNYTSQTVTFPANSGTAQNVTITVTDNSSCDGSAVLNFGLENLTGGQGTPFVGPNSTRTLTVTDNDVTTGAVIARQAFDGLVSDTWSIAANSGTISTTAGASDFPANSRILSGTASWQVNSATSVLDLAAFDVSGYANMSAVVRLSATTTSSGNGLDTGDSVKVFVALNGAAFSSTPDIAVRGNANARWAYSGTQTAATAAGTPINVQSPAGTGNVNGPGTLTITIPDGTQTVAIRVRGRNNDASEFFNVDDIQITGDYCATTYYSRANGNVGDAIWSDSPSGSAGSVTFDRFKTMHVQGHTVTVNANTRVDDVVVDASGTLALSANTLTVSGDVMDVNGSLTAADNSTVVFNSSDATILESTGALSLYNLTVNTPGDMLTDATISMRGTLLLSAGDFDVSTGALTLSSTNTGTGRLGVVAPGATYTGDMTVQRYIPAGATNWRLMGSPVAGQTVNEWKDDFTTAGFPGSHVPSFDSPQGSGNLWPSVRWYDETVLNANPNVGLVGVSNITQSLAQGQGFAAWCGTSLATTTAFTVDMSGTPHIAQSPISLPITYSSSGNPTADGYNLVSNPLPSPISWEALDRTNVSTTVRIFNPAAGNIATYTVGGSQTNGGVDVIHSSQAFYVQTTGTSPSLQVEEADKVNALSGGFFGGSETSLFEGVRLRISSGVNTFSDEAVVTFNAGSPGLDVDDVTKLILAHPDAPQIDTRTTSGEVLAVNAFGEYTTDIAIPVAVNVALDGTYTITASGMENLGLTCLVLEDLSTGASTPMVEGATYSFAINAADDADVARFLLHASAPVPMITDNATCFGTNDGRGSVIFAGSAPMDVSWSDANGNVFLEQTIESGVAVTGELLPGEYSVRVSSGTACGQISSVFTIEEPAAMEASAAVQAATCANSEDGLVDLTVLGGTAPYNYAWSNGSDTEDLIAATGTYTVDVTDTHGCALASQEFTIQSLDELEAVASTETNTTIVNTPVAFTTTVEEGTTLTWNFGDETTSDETSPSHSWSVPGTYTVTLTVDNGTCTDTWSTDVVVEMSTGIANATATTVLNAWYANDKFVVEHSINNGQPVTVEVLDATGRLHITRKAAGVPDRITIPADGLSTGVWFLRFSNNGTQRTMRVPLVR